MWYRISKNEDKKPPQEIVKAMDIFARNAIKKYLYYKRDYSPDPKIIEAIMRRFYEKIDENYGSLDKTIMYTDSMSLKNLVDQNIYEIIGKLK